jgi:hypothetical protein
MYSRLARHVRTVAPGLEEVEVRCGSLGIVEVEDPHIVVEEALVDTRHRIVAEEDHPVDIHRTVAEGEYRTHRGVEGRVELDIHSPAVEAVCENASWSAVFTKRGSHIRILLLRRWVSIPIVLRGRLAVASTLPAVVLLSGIERHGGG